MRKELPKMDKKIIDFYQKYFDFVDGQTAAGSDAYDIAELCETIALIPHYLDVPTNIEKRIEQLADVMRERSENNILSCEDVLQRYAKKHA